MKTFSSDRVDELMKKVQKIWLLVFVMLLWGSLAPFIKVGYEALHIDTSFLPNVLLFAGIRFSICGAVIIAISLLYSMAKKSTEKIDHKTLFLVFMAGFFAIVLHYGFNYIGLTVIDSSEAVLIKQLGTVIFIPFSFLFFKEDRFTWKKTLAAICGLCGVMILNWNPTGIRIGKGELFVIAASFSMVISSVLGKRAMKIVHPLTMTGYSQLFGGVVLVFLGLLGGGSLHFTSLISGLVFLYICIASIVSYCLWNWILSDNNLSELFIIKFLEPVFAALFGALLLGEQVLQPKFLVALTLTGIAIFFSQ